MCLFEYQAVTLMFESHPRSGLCIDVLLHRCAGGWLYGQFQRCPNGWEPFQIHIVPRANMRKQWGSWFAYSIPKERFWPQSQWVWAALMQSTGRSVTWWSRRYWIKKNLINRVASLKQKSSHCQEPRLAAFLCVANIHSCSMVLFWFFHATLGQGNDGDSWKIPVEGSAENWGFLPHLNLACPLAVTMG